MTDRAHALVNATLQKKGATVAFLQSFTKDLNKYLDWPDQHVRTAFSLIGPEATVSCTLWLSLHLTDRLPVADGEVSITLTARSLKSVPDGFELLVDDIDCYHVVGHEHPKTAKSWSEVFQHLNELLASRIDEMFVKTFGAEAVAACATTPANV